MSKRVAADILREHGFHCLSDAEIQSLTSGTTLLTLPTLTTLLVAEVLRLRECNRIGATAIEKWGCHAIANDEEVKRLRFESAYVREVLLTANPLTFATDGTLAGDDVPLAEVARQAAEKIYELRRLHSEMVAEVERLGIELARLREASP